MRGQLHKSAQALTFRPLPTKQRNDLGTDVCRVSANALGPLLAGATNGFWHSGLRAVANLNSGRHVTVRPCMRGSLAGLALTGTIPDRLLDLARRRGTTLNQREPPVRQKSRPSEDNTGLASGTAGSYRPPPASLGRSSCARRSEKAQACPACPACPKP